MEQVHQQRFTEQESQHDACGIGAVVNISGQRTHRAVDDALKIVEKLEHRTGKDADGRSEEHTSELQSPRIISSSFRLRIRLSGSCGKKIMATP